MTVFRGYFALNGREIANSSRVVAHLGTEPPARDIEAFGVGDPDACALVPWEDHPKLWEISPTSVEVSPGLWTPPLGAKRFGPGLSTIDGCWGPATLCATCTTQIGYDDSWPGLREFLGYDHLYRPELAPWYSTELPESAEFGGVWVMDVKGLDAMAVERNVTQAVGSGGIAAPARNPARTVTFEAVLIACSHAGVKFGLDWLTDLLRETNDDPDAILRYFAASPSGTNADPVSLLREIHNVVLTRAPEIIDTVNTLGGFNKHANLYRVSWDIVALSPYSYLPEIKFPIDWDQITRQPINWVHAADCEVPEACDDMPLMFSTECVPEEIEVLTIPPPVCGGCMPVGGIDKYLFRVPTQDYAFRSRETAVSMVIKNTGAYPLTLQAFWRVCGTDIRCEDNRFPTQISGLPADAELHLDGVSGRALAWYDDRWRQPVDVVGTPNGAPWRPPLIDRRTCWDLIVQTAAGAEFTVELVLADREN